MNSSVTVLGSLNIDLVASVDALPASGETVSARQLTRFFGGKGANQAVAAARQEVSVSMIGCVGADAEGQNYQKRLQEEGIDVSSIRQDEDALTGTAMIGVDAKGENLIMVAPEANGNLTPYWVSQHRGKIESAACLLLQFEVPREASLAAIMIANAAGVPVIVNASPTDAKFPWGSARIDAVILNESEAEQLVELPSAQLSAQRERWFAAMREYAIDRLIITRGAGSTLALVSEGKQLLDVPTMLVCPVDTVGAGDAFAGTFAAAFSEGVVLTKALELANIAGALTTLGAGAQEAMPTKQATTDAATTGAGSSRY